MVIASMSSRIEAFAQLLTLLIIFIFLAVSMLSAAHLLDGTDVAEVFGVVSSANAAIVIEQSIVIAKIIDNSFFIVPSS